MEVVEKLQLKRRISELHVNVFTRKWLKVFRYITVGVIIIIIWCTPLAMVSQAPDNTWLWDQVPTPSNPSGQELYHAVYRGAEENYLPKVPDQVADPVYQQWSTMDQIYTGLAYVQRVSALNPNLPSLFTTYIGNSTKKKFIQIVFAERTNNTDLWWGSLNKTVEAATIIQELGAMNDTIGQLDQQLDYTLQLADYYSTIAPNNVTVDGISVPGWTMLKLKDLLTYRVTSFLSSKTIS